jgi:lycopene cyclase domain-containing protein
MSYAVLCLPFLAVSAVLAAIAWRRAPAGHAAALALTAGGLVLLTAVFDSLMIAAGLFDYADAPLLGPRLGLAPIEDFAYPIAALLLCSAVWTLLGRADASAARDRPARAPRGAER